MGSIVQNIITVVGFLILAGFGYYLYTQNQSDFASGTLDSQVISSQQFVRQVATLQNLELDTAIITEPEFRNLTDFRQPISPVPVGNENPF